MQDDDFLGPQTSAPACSGPL